MKKYPLLVVALILIAGLTIGYSLSHFFKTTEHQGQTKGAKKLLYWIDPMEPTIHYSKPGTSRMGMKLVPVYSQNQSQSMIHINPAIIDNLGIRIAPVAKGELAKRIETMGYVEPNENKISHIHTYAEGWIKILYVKAVGDVVKQNQVVMQLYAPKLVNAQDEYLIALDSKNKALIEASYNRLQAFHIPEEQIQRLTKTRKASQLIDIYPHQNGVVTKLDVREGMYVTPGTEMMSIVDLSSIWMIAQVFSEEESWIKVGDLAEAHLTAFPDKIWKGAVEYIYPEIDPTTRALKVRIHFNNPDDILKPNMYASITLLAQPKQNVLNIPLEALIRSSQGNRVIVALGQGRFQARMVKTGIESGNRVEILSGLKQGEEVVISGQFLIDSEENLKAGLERLQSPTKQMSKDNL